MKNFLFVLTLLFSLSSFSQSPVDKSFPPEELFALGSYYYPEQWDSSQWERDLKKMSEMGIKFTHFAEFAWSMKRENIILNGWIVQSLWRRSMV